MKCQFCGMDTLEIFGKVDRCPACGARKGENKPDVTQTARGTFADFIVPVLDERHIGVLLEYLGYPLAEADYVANRPGLLPDEAEFDTHDDVPWPSMILPNSRSILPVIDLLLMQRYFLKYPHQAPGDRPGIFDVPFYQWRMLKSNRGSRTPEAGRQRWVIRVQIYSGIFFAILMLSAVLLFISIVFAYLHRVDGNLSSAVRLFVVFVIGMMVLGVLNGIIGRLKFFIKKVAYTIAEPDIRRQVNRYLDWAKERRREDAQAQGEQAGPAEAV